MTALEDAATQEGFAPLKGRELGPRPGDVASTFTKKAGPDGRGLLVILLIWEPGDDNTPELKVDVYDEKHASDAARRALDELARRFEQIVVQALGRERVTVERKPWGIYVF
jgi:hypothetical protein